MSPCGANTILTANKPFAKGKCRSRQPKWSRCLASHATSTTRTASVSQLLSNRGVRDVNYTSINDLKLNQLRDICSATGITYSKRKKEELVQAILDAASEAEQHLDAQLDKDESRDRRVNVVEHSRFWRNRNTWLENTRAKTAGNPSGMSVTWLGTSSGAPSKARNVSSMALRVGQPETILLVDVGEGTQYQFANFGLDVTAVKQVYITHHHGDHIFGLPGLIAARNAAFVSQGQDPAPLAIFGPPGTASMVLSALRVGLRSGMTSACNIAITEWCLSEKDGMATTAAEGTNGLVTVCRRPPDQASPRWKAPVNVRVIAETRVPGASKHAPPMPVCDGLTWTVAGAGGLRVQAAQLYHRVPCWGYVFQEPSGLQNGDERSGRKVVLLGDTHDSSPMLRIAQGADLLSHEATYMGHMHWKAKVATHSTGHMAGTFANAIRARQLVLTHFSGRYGHGGEAPSVVGASSDEEQEDAQDVERLRREAEGGMRSRNVACAQDGFTWRVRLEKQRFGA